MVRSKIKHWRTARRFLAPKVICPIKIDVQKQKGTMSPVKYMLNTKKGLCPRQIDVGCRTTSARTTAYGARSRPATRLRCARGQGSSLEPLWPRGGAASRLGAAGFLGEELQGQRVTRQQRTAWLGQGPKAGFWSALGARDRQQVAAVRFLQKTAARWLGRKGYAEAAVPIIHGTMPASQEANAKKREDDGKDSRLGN